MQRVLEEIGGGTIASIQGRFYAMDRDRRWERVKAAYDLLTLGRAEFEAPDAMTALQKAYLRDEGDEFVRPTRIAGFEPDP
jgi:2,3-bisphosphoglycerate-independent phosphoglycerate mutase